VRWTCGRHPPAKECPSRQRLTNLARGLGERPSFSLADAIIKEKRREADSRNVVLGRCSSEEGGVRKPFLARRLLLHFCARGMSWKGDGTRSDENIRTRFGEMLTIHSMKFVGLGERVLYYCIISIDGLVAGSLLHGCTRDEHVRGWTCGQVWRQLGERNPPPAMHAPRRSNVSIKSTRGPHQNELKYRA
jgi:hypothetical protein